MDAFYLEPPADRPLSQGDVLRDVTCVDAITGPTGKVKTVIVASYDCEIDKPSGMLYVAVCSSFAKQGVAFQEAIRRGDVRHVLYLPPHVALPEGYADLRTMFRIKYPDIGAELGGTTAHPQRVLADSSRRILALGESGLLALQGKLARYFGYERNEARQ